MYEVDIRRRTVAVKVTDKDPYSFFQTRLESQGYECIYFRGAVGKWNVSGCWVYLPASPDREEEQL